MTSENRQKHRVTIEPRTAQEGTTLTRSIDVHNSHNSTLTVYMSALPAAPPAWPHVHDQHFRPSTLIISFFYLLFVLGASVMLSFLQPLSIPIEKTTCISATAHAQSPQIFNMLISLLLHDKAGSTSHASQSPYDFADRFFPYDSGCLVKSTAR